MRDTGRGNQEDVPFAEGSIEEALRRCASFARPSWKGMGVAIFGNLLPALEDCIKKGAALFSPRELEILYGGGTLCEACRFIGSLPAHVVCVTGDIDETGWLAAVLDQTGRKGAVLFFEPHQKLLLATAFGDGEFSTFPVIPEAYALPLEGHQKNESRLLAGIFLWAGGQAESLRDGVDRARCLEQ